ncbi:hypothetical protein ACIBTZ_10700 [Micromonospora sp. NPDC049460]|uniref:hypothetical protein n=1 Tax=unclassified Micromonospora TaxID=2617518 RepID=UPI0037181AB6
MVVETPDAATEELFEGEAIGPEIEDASQETEPHNLWGVAMEFGHFGVGLSPESPTAAAVRS